MADETNEIDGGNDDDDDSNEPAPDADAPTEETAVVDDAPAGNEETQPAVTTAAAPPPDAPARERSSLTVPTWAAVVAGVVVFALLLGGSFALGRSTAEDDGATQAISVPSVDEIPRIVPGTPDELPRGVARAFFGVSVEAAQGGVTVLRISSGSPAEDAGFREGDLITKVDGDDVSTPAEFADAIHEHAPGDEVTITYTRDGDTNEASVHLQETVQRVTPND